MKQVVLALGNHMNRHNGIEEVKGFKIQDLNKVTFSLTENIQKKKKKTKI